MDKEELIQLFKRYNENSSKLELRKRELRMIERRLEGSYEIETNITSSCGINNDIRSKNSKSNKVENAVIKSMGKNEKDKERLIELKEEIFDLQNKVDEISIRLKGLKYKEREILIAYYAEGRTAEDIAYNLYFNLFNRTCSKRYIEKIIKKSTEKISKM